MKNNEKFLNDLGNIPDRFLDEIHDSEKQSAVVKRNKIQWLKPVSVAACIAAVAAVPVIIMNLKPDNINIPSQEDHPVTSAVTTSEGTSYETTASTTVRETEHTSESTVTGHYTAVTSSDASAMVTSEITTAEKSAVTEVVRSEEQQAVPETAPQNSQQEEAPASSAENQYITAEDPDKELVIAAAPHLMDENAHPFWLYDYETDVYTNYDYEADYVILNAQKLSERYFGNVNDEETLINIARKVFSENLEDISGINIVEYIERDFIINYETGERTPVERTNDPYSISYNEEFDVWTIAPASMFFRAENGKTGVAMWEWPPYLMVRGSDGKILAFWH